MAAIRGIIEYHTQSMAFYGTVQVKNNKYCWKVFFKAFVVVSRVNNNEINYMLELSLNRFVTCTLYDKKVPILLWFEHEYARFVSLQIFLKTLETKRGFA